MYCFGPKLAEDVQFWMDTGLKLYSAPGNGLADVTFERLIKELEVRDRNCCNIHMNNHVMNLRMCATVLCGTHSMVSSFYRTCQRQHRSLHPILYPLRHTKLNYIAIISGLEICPEIRLFNRTNTLNLVKGRWIRNVSNWREGCCVSSEK